MKKILLLSCFLIVSFIAFSQSKTAYVPELNIKKMVANNVVTLPLVTPSNFAAAPSPIWSDDFSSPANWVIDHDQNACSLDWQIGQNSCTGSYPSADIVSTTAANGWAMVDSDAYGGATGGTEVEDSWLTMANPVDLNGYTDVNIEFETNYRSYNSEVCYVVVGVADANGIVEWPELDPTSSANASGLIGQSVFMPFPGLASGGFQSTNPQLVSVNISPALVGLTSTELENIYIRFHWTGTWGYAWFVDDVAIIETPEHELRFSSETFGGWWMGYNDPASALGVFGAGTDYTFYPMLQATTQPLRIEGVVSSTGIQTQENTTMNVEIDENGTITSLSSTPMSSPSGSSDTVSTSSPFTPANMGLHNISWWASSDSFPTTPVTTKSMIVTDTIYGIDYDWDSDGANASGYAYLSRTLCGQVLANVFDIFTDVSMTSISFHVSENSIPGASVSVELYEEDAASDPILLDGSDSYKLQSSDIGNWVTLPLSSPLSAGTSYLAAVRGEVHPTDTVGISTSGNDNTVSYIQDNGCDIGTGGFGYWYGGSGYLIRMNFGPAAWVLGTAINDVENSQFNVYPNPTNGLFTIELDGNSKYVVSVKNVLGQTVFTTTTNGMNTNIDLSSFDKGIYTVELKDENAIYTEKVIVE
tara:strand:+ start:526 stop:2457 length:1932 start_codon:yes stop_codon:yes gene_type:complete